MKIIAQSQVPQKMPYLHLGYLAAAARTTSVGLLGLGLALVCLGLIAVRNLRGIWSGDVIANLTGQPLRHRAGLLLVVLGVMMVFAAPFAGPPVRRHAATLTKVNLRALEGQFHVLGLEEGSASPGQPAFRAGTFLGSDLTNACLATSAFPAYAAKMFTDGWDRAISGKFEAVSNQWRITLSSAGPDGRFGTADDLSMTNLLAVP